MSQPSIEAEIGLCLLFAAVDGEISEGELGALSVHMGTLLGDDFDPMRLPPLIEGEMSTISDLGVDEYVAALPARIPPQRRASAVQAACIVACADGLAPEEEETVRHVCAVLAVDADAMIESVKARLERDDLPNDTTQLIADHLRARGWVDPMQLLRDVGVHVSGAGALALEYTNSNGVVLGLEHHTRDGSVRLHATDEGGRRTGAVLFPREKATELLEAIVGVQDELTSATVDDRFARLTELFRG